MTGRKDGGLSTSQTQGEIQQFLTQSEPIRERIIKQNRNKRSSNLVNINQEPA